MKINKISLYVDDIRECPDGYILARDHNTACYFLRYNKVDKLSLDHDLGNNSKSGYDICEWLCYEYYENGLNYFPEKIYFHTANPVGKQNMYELLLRYMPEDVELYK